MSSASSVPISERPWGASTPNHSAAHLAYALKGSPDTNKENLDAGMHVCPMCNKQYSRHCDLNKHLKTHSRSYKCPVEGCRYNSFGWPTEKELERHHNDKHSAAPKVFSCWYQPCAYTSKRESNCKQHMEKAHGWEYIRSRAGNRDELPHTTEIGPYGDTIFVSDHSDIDLNPDNVPDFSLAPSLSGQRLPTPHDVSLPMDLSRTVQYVSGIYSPWTSPVTPLSTHEPFMRVMGQEYASESPGPAQDDELLKIPVDPRLYHSVQDSSRVTIAVPDLPVATGCEAMLKTLPTIVTAKSSPVVNSQVLTPASDSSPALRSIAVSHWEADGPGDPKSGSTPGIPTTQTLRFRDTSLRKTDGKRYLRFSKESDEEHSDEEDEPPAKRNRGPEGEDDELGDPKMICPFRAEHPEIYTRDLDPKYASCHTEHLNISTVVRHLGRPAHRLKVDSDRSSLSSFDIVDPEYDHPAAALCRKCWTPFDNPQAFQDHTKSKCTTRSRSKREKFDLIRDTFCRLPRDPASREGGSDSGKARQGKDMHKMTDEKSHQPDTVSRNEFDGLVQRVTELERVLVAKMPRSTPRIVPQKAQTVARAFSSSPALPSAQASQPFGFYTYNDGAGPSRALGGNNLVQQPMGSLDQQAIGRGAQAGQYSETMSNAPGFVTRASSRSDNVSTLRRETTPAMVGRVPQQQQRFSENNNPRRAGMPTYGPAAAAMAAGGSQIQVGPAVADDLQLAGNQREEFEAGEASQESTNATLRNQWEHAVQMGEEVLGRGMDFFNTSSDDLSNFLDMGSQ